MYKKGEYTQLLKLYHILVMALLFTHFSCAQLVTSKKETPFGLVKNVLLGPGVTVSNIKYTGAINAIGYFDGSKSNIGLSKGIVMTTGTIFGPDGPAGFNNQNNAGIDNKASGYAPLTSLVNTATYNASVLEFDFIPMADTVRFRYVFGSEEYPEYVDKEFNDIFAFFISGPGISGTKNIALLPNGQPVTINTVNDKRNTQYYIDNWGGKTVQYDGFTKVLTAIAQVQCGKTYHLAISIADVADGIYDSGMFLEANSLSSKVELEVSKSIAKQYYAEDNKIPEGCGSATIKIKKLGNSTNKKFTIPIQIKGSAKVGTDVSNTIPGSVTLPIGVDSVSFSFDALKDVIKEDIDSIEVDVMIPDACGNFTPFPVVVYIQNIDPIAVKLDNDTVYCEGKSTVLKPIVDGGMIPYSYLWSTGEKTDSIQVKPLATQNYSITINDICLNTPTTATAQVFVPKYLALTVDPLPDITNACPYVPTAVEAIPHFGGLKYTYAWSDGKKVISREKLDTIKPSRTTKYSVVVQDQCGAMASASFLYTVTSPPLLVKTFGDSVVCNGDTALIYARATGGLGNYTYKWAPGGSSNDSLYVSPFNSMSYNVYVGDDCKTFTVKGSYRVTVQKPIVNFEYSGSPYIDEEIRFTNVSPNYPTYHWDLGNGATSSQRHTHTTYLDSNVYRVTLSIVDTLGCKNSISKNIQIFYPNSVYIPNSFTPNGDRINDVFIPIITSAQSVSTLIFNRWGEIVFESNELIPRWDGTYNGVKCPNDVYIYKVEVISLAEKMKIYTGHVTLFN